MTMPEKASKVVSGTVEALKGQPLALTLVILNVMFLAGVMYTAHDFFQRLENASLRKDNMVSQMMERCMTALPNK